MAIKKDMLDQLLSGRDPKDVFAAGGMVDELKQAVASILSHPCASRLRFERPKQLSCSMDGRAGTLLTNGLQTSEAGLFFARHRARHDAKVGGNQITKLSSPAA